MRQLPREPRSSPLDCHLGIIFTLSARVNMDPVFIVPELAEAIFLCLDMSTLLVSALRVSKAWNGFITKSGPIQKALFFQPAVRDFDDDSSPRINPLLMRRFGRCFFDVGVDYRRFSRSDSFYWMPWTFDNVDSQLSTPDSRDREARSHDISDMSPLECQQIQESCRKIRRKDASWRKMLVSQPPPPHLGCMSVRMLTEGISTVENDVEIEISTLHPEAQPQSYENVRMGLLYDLVQDRVAQKHGWEVWFRVVWHETTFPNVTDMCESQCRTLLQHTSVVVEVGVFWSKEHEEPRDVEPFNRRFRSSAYQPLEVSACEKILDESARGLPPVFLRSLCVEGLF